VPAEVPAQSLLSAATLLVFLIVIQRQALSRLMSCLRFSNRGGFTCFLRVALLLGFFTAGGGEAWVQTGSVPSAPPGLAIGNFLITML
jgi:hypothetical protein